MISAPLVCRERSRSANIASKFITIMTTKLAITEHATLFITGMARSGTTLVEKVFSGHPELSVVPQPFPYIFLDAKRDFLAAIHYGNCDHPLSHYFLEERYDIQDLTAFLGDYCLSPEKVRSIFSRMERYSGQIHRAENCDYLLGHLSAGRFLDTIVELLYAMRYNETARIFGSKEIFCEEFSPYLAASGVKCIVIIRDPRDVITSLNARGGAQYGGKARPTLFHVRNWRKSVAFSLLLAEHPNFQWIRYEDLVTQPLVVIRELTRFLGIRDFEEDQLRGEILDQTGNVWDGNSSHNTKLGITADSVGRYRALMPRAVQEYIECMCLPEMRYLGYSCNAKPTKCADVFSAFREPIRIERKEFQADYSSSPDHVRQELTRLRLLGSPSLTGSEHRFFLSPIVHQKLAAALGNDVANTLFT